MSESPLTEWFVRARPPRRRLVEAVALSLLAATASITLLGGSGLLIGKAAGRGGLAALGGLLVAIELVAFLRAPLRYQERIVTHRVALGSMVRWRTWLFDVVALRLPGSLSRRASGELLDRALEDIDALEDLYVRLALPLVGALTAGLLGTVVVAVLAPAAGAVLGATVLVGIAASFAVSVGAGREADEEATWRGVATARTVDLVVGLGELTMATGAGGVLERIDEAERRRAALARRAGHRRGLGMAVVGMLSGLGVLGVVLVSARSSHHGSITSAEAAALSLVAVATVEPLLGVVLAALRAPEIAASARRLDELVDAPIAVVEPCEPLTWPVEALLEVDHVAAPAGLGGPLVLSDVSFRVAPGERIALLGASGAGKSTVCALLLRFLDPTRGSISVGGTPLERLSTDEIRDHVALLDQSPVLFGGTIADSLRLGDPDATDEELHRVLDLVELGELGDGGLDLQIAEAGASLSGGQQRRLALARVLLRRPALLLLDEPTAGLDEEQGHSILESCLDVTPDAAVVLLTHRVAETQGADRVYLLTDGVLNELDTAARLALLV